MTKDDGKILCFFCHKRIDSDGVKKHMKDCESFDQQIYDKKLNGMYDKICYYPMFFSWIRPSFIISTDAWAFRLCDENGNYRSVDYKARSNMFHPEFKWRDIVDG